MSRIKQFKLPDLGEGLTEGEILQWLVQPGEEGKLNQPIVEGGTAKAAVEIPSPYAGGGTEIFHGAGETVDVGSPIIAVDTDPGAGPVPMASAGTPLLSGIGEPPAAPATDFEAPAPGRGVPAGLEHETAPPSAETLASVTVAGAEEAVEPGLIGGPAPGG